ncbi:MAG: hypothetical protein SPJ23_01170 [Eubacteriales bacterium]|nr:hypothetical protein [Eubacteriales bacterium]
MFHNDSIRSVLQAGNARRKKPMNLICIIPKAVTLVKRKIKENEKALKTFSEKFASGD